MMRWYADRAAWRLIGLRYLPWFAGLSLVWEIAQLPLYTLWREAPASWIAPRARHGADAGRWYDACVAQLSEP